MKILDGLKSAVDFMVKPPTAPPQGQTVQASSERVIAATQDLAQKQDILGNLVRGIKGVPPPPRKRGNAA